MKRNYTPVVSSPVCMDTLRRDILKLAGLPTPQLNVSVKLPVELEAVFPYMDLKDSRGNFLGSFVVRVNKSVPSKDICRWTNKPRKSSAHRIFIMVGTRAVPAGRANQAKL